MAVHLVERDPRIGFSLVRGPFGERWIRDGQRLGWGLQLAYERWTPNEEVARIRCIKRYEKCADCWFHGDIKGMIMAMAGPAPIVALPGGEADEAAQ